MRTTDYPDHWKRGCSNAHRWVNCPGSIEGIDEEKEAGFMAKLGTLGHKLTESLLRQTPLSLDDDDHAILNELNKDERRWFKRAVAMCVDFVNDRISELNPTEVHFERKIASAIVEDHGGTSDVTLVEKEHNILWIIDFKFGAEAVEVDDNNQVMSYLNLAREVHPETDYGNWIFKGTIVQPSYRGAQTYTFPREQLDAFREKMVKATMLSERHGDPSWCRYCPLLATCEEAAKTVIRAVDEFGTCSEVVNELSGQPTAEQVEKMERIVMMHKMAKDAYKEAAAILKRWFNEGVELKYHRVSSSNIRTWNRRALESVADRLPSDKLADAMKIDLVTPTQLQRALDMDRKEFDRQFADVLELTNRPSLKCGVTPSPNELAQDLPIWTGSDD